MADLGRIAVLTQHGVGYAVTRGLTQTEQLGQPVPVGRWIRTQPAAVSGTHVFFGVGSDELHNAGSESAREIVKLDGATLKSLGTVDVGAPFYGLTVDRDGRTLYAISSERAEVIVVDGNQMKVLRRFPIPTKYAAFGLTARE